MIGLDYIMAGYLHLAAGEITCQLKKTPEIRVSASDSALKVDHSKTREQLDRFSIDTVSPYEGAIQSHVGGLMSGEVKTTSNMSLMTEKYPHYNTGCLMIDKINVKIHINPTIFIASHYKKTGCMYKAIMEHEKKHVNVDRMLVNKYTGLISKALEAKFKPVGYKVGPFPIGRMNDVQQSLTEASNQIVKDYSAKMNAERRVLQQKIDSREEYDRVNNSCRGRD